MQAFLKDKISTLFYNNKHRISGENPARVKALREQAFADFIKLGFPDEKTEAWKNTDLKKTLEQDFTFNFEPADPNIDIDHIFRCEVPDFDTHIISLYNGWYISKNKPLTHLHDGTIIGSFASAMEAYPELVLKHFNQYARERSDGLNALNTAFAQDGVFIYVPDNVEVYKTLQMVNVLNKEDNLFVQNRNLVIMGKNSKLTLVHCDDSHNHKSSFTNTVTEVFMDEGAQLDHYKLQNLNNETSLINSTYFYQSAGSNLTTYAISLNGGLIRNDLRITLDGEGSNADIYGLYLVDKNQHVDNHVFVDHAKPGCTSNELFKGILDDHATAVFNGHILVRKDAQRTNAYQKNRNVLLTDKATINTKPFLEIYADDVKCSHGATVGQLDENAMFYIKSRGISEYNARLLLMYAFAAEVISKVSILPLKERMDDLVKKRLRGELAVCDQCVLHCKNQENKFEFKIDMTKI